MNQNKVIFVTIPQGQCIRDFLILPPLKHLQSIRPDYRLVVLSPAYNISAFLDLLKENHKLAVARMETPVGVGRNARLLSLRKKINNRYLKQLLLTCEALQFRPPHYLRNIFEHYKPSALISTHPMPSHDYEVFMTARRMNIPTLGIVKSWDNVGKGLTCRTDYLSVWNPINRAEAIQLESYHPSQVSINGAPSFDPYYDKRWIQDRDSFILSMGLDPLYPIITYATAGVYDIGYYGRDETYIVDALLKIIHEDDTLKGTQLIIRLHPTTRLEYFWQYKSHPSVAFSFASYMPALGWYTTEDDIRQQVNLLKHSNLIVTPGSSWAIEAAIFDTPTIVPVYSDLQPDHAKAQFDGYTLARHFKPLVENNWLPLSRSYEQLRVELKDAFIRPEKYSRGRTSIVENYVYHQDSDSSKRIANWIAETVDSI